MNFQSQNYVKKYQSLRNNIFRKIHLIKEIKAKSSAEKKFREAKEQQFVLKAEKLMNGKYEKEQTAKQIEKYQKMVEEEEEKISLAKETYEIAKQCLEDLDQYFLQGKVQQRSEQINIETESQEEEEFSRSVTRSINRRRKIKKGDLVQESRSCSRKLKKQNNK